MSDKYVYVTDYYPGKTNFSKDGSYVKEWKLLLKNNIRIIKLTQFGFVDGTEIFKRYNVFNSFGPWCGGTDTYRYVNNTKGNII